MIRGQDLVVLLKLHVLSSTRWTVRSLGEELSYDSAGISRSLSRLAASDLYDPQRKRARAAQSEEFLVHAVKYLFPATLGAPSRGIPTAWAVPPLSTAIASTEQAVPVWPHRQGDTRGFAVKPVHRLAVDASLRDPELREWLALVDGLRIGDARERRIAADVLSERVRLAATGVVVG